MLLSTTNRLLTEIKDPMKNKAEKKYLRIKDKRRHKILSNEIPEAHASQSHKKPPNSPTILFPFLDVPYTPDIVFLVFIVLDKMGDTKT